jgi:LysM repeat protein
MTAVDPDARPVRQAAADARAARSLTRVCPYLATADGGWRSSTVSRDHRCRAVSPPAPLAAEKQRRLCLTGDYPTCATFEAARAARPVAHDRMPILPRPLARTAPVVLDHGRLGVTMPAVRADRTTVQTVLVVLLALAFAAIVLARLTGGEAPAGAVGSPSVAASSAPGAAGSATPATSRRPTAAPSSGGSAPPAASDGGAGPSAAPGATAQTYKVKSGDTLIGIAAKFGTTAKAIAELNGLSDPSSLHSGQVLRIP